MCRVTCVGTTTSYRFLHARTYEPPVSVSRVSVIGSDCVWCGLRLGGIILSLLRYCALDYHLAPVPAPNIYSPTHAHMRSVACFARQAVNNEYVDATTSEPSRASRGVSTGGKGTLDSGQ